MKYPTILIALAVFGFWKRAAAGPVPALSNDISESEESFDDPTLMEDDSTTRGLERLSSAATCLVAGIEYTHGQQIYRKDPCEFCLCLDGEMFCWWQDCPPTMEGPCKDRGPFSPCVSIPANPTKSTTSTIKTTSKTSKTATSTAQTTKISTSPSESSTSSENATDFLTTEEDELSSDSPNTSTELHNSICIVMGKEYQIGDKLPHDTGNCVECLCGSGAKVTCSPHQCAPAGEDINDYRPPDPRQQLPEVF